MSSNFKHKIPFPEIIRKKKKGEKATIQSNNEAPIQENSTAILILAAGNSSRLGRPKQLVSFNGKPLIVHIIEQALYVKANAVFVVLGGNQASILPKIKHLPATIVLNEDWEKGMGNSISTGVQAVLKKHPNTTGIVTTLCDQPFVSAELIYQIIQKQAATKAEIVAASYAGNLGVPAFFSQSFFEKLIHLKAKRGAKKLIQQHLSSVEAVPFPEGIFDIDTPEDLVRIDEWAKIVEKKNKMRKQ